MLVCGQHEINHIETLYDTGRECGGRFVSARYSGCHSGGTARSGHESTFESGDTIYYLLRKMNGRSDLKLDIASHTVDTGRRESVPLCRRCETIGPESYATDGFRHVLHDNGLAFG